MKKGQMSKFRPIRTTAAKMQTKSVKTRTQQRLDEYIQRYNTALYNCGESKQ